MSQPAKKAEDECAHSGSQFLDALWEAACYLGKRAIDENLYNDIKTAHMVAQRCADLAGGDKYRSFYQYLLGV